MQLVEASHEVVCHLLNAPQCLTIHREPPTERDRHRAEAILLRVQGNVHVRQQLLVKRRACPADMEEGNGEVRDQLRHVDRVPVPVEPERLVVPQARHKVEPEAPQVGGLAHEDAARVDLAPMLLVEEHLHVDVPPPARRVHRLPGAHRLEEQELCAVHQLLPERLAADVDADGQVTAVVVRVSGVHEQFGLGASRLEVVAELPQAAPGVDAHRPALREEAVDLDLHALAVRARGVGARLAAAAQNERVLGQLCGEVRELDECGLCIHDLLEHEPGARWPPALRGRLLMPQHTRGVGPCGAGPAGVLQRRRRAPEQLQGPVVPVLRDLPNVAEALVPGGIRLADVQVVVPFRHRLDHVALRITGDTGWGGDGALLCEVLVHLLCFIGLISGKACGQAVHRVG